MEALGIDLATTRTTVWGIQSQTKSHTDSNTHCFVIKRDQSPLCGATEAKNLAFCDGSAKESSINARLFWSPNLSQKNCLPGSGAVSGPAEVDQHDR